MVVGIVFEFGLERGEAVLAAHVDHVVDPPEDLPNAPRWVPEALERVHEDDSSSDAAADALDGFEDGVDDVRAGFEDVGPDEVEQVD